MNLNKLIVLHFTFPGDFFTIPGGEDASFFFVFGPESINSIRVIMGVFFRPVRGTKDVIQFGVSWKHRPGGFCERCGARRRRLARARTGRLWTGSRTVRPLYALFKRASGGRRPQFTAFRGDSRAAALKQ